MGKVRSRPSKVCDFCKRRKVKCDLGNPCSTCVKYKKSPCVYTETVEGENNGFIKSPQDQSNKYQPQQPQQPPPQQQQPLPNVYPSRYSSSSSLSTSNGTLYSSTRDSFSSSNSSNSLEYPNIPNTRNVMSLPTIHDASNSHSNANSNIELVQDELVLLKQKLSNLEQQLTVQQQQQLQALFPYQNQQTVESQSNQQSQLNSPNLLQGYPQQRNIELGNTVNNGSSTKTPGCPLQGYFTNDSTAASSQKTREIGEDVGPIELKSLLGFNPIDSPNDKINFHDGYNPTKDREPTRRKHLGPLAWKTLLKIDNAMVPVWAHMANIKNRYRTRGFMPHAEDGATQAEKNFSEKVYNDECEGEVRPFRETVTKPVTSNPSELLITQEQLHEKALCLGLSFYQGGLDAEMELVEKIRLVLPKQKVIWKLYNRFFTHLYAALPLLDEVELKTQLEKLIGPEDYKETKVTVHVEKKLDFAYLGILLIVLRFSYISLFSHDSTINEINFQTHDPSPKAQLVKFLLNNPIDIDVIDVAQLCLDQFNIMRTPSLTLMQLALMTRVYHLYAPEDGDGMDGGDAQIFNASLIQMAKLIGLHRDPDNFQENYYDERTNHLGRKIWYYLLIMDMNHAMANGTSLMVDIDEFDTKHPTYSPGNENVIDVELEKIACSCFPDFHIVYGQMSTIFKMISKVRGSVSMTELVKSVNSMEIHFREKYGSLGHNYNMSSSSKNTMPDAIRLKIFFQGGFFLVSMYLHIFNYYEKKNNLQLAYYYIKKMLAVVIDEMMPCFSCCVSHKQNMFRNSIDLIATPSFEMVAHKSMVVILGIFLRLKFFTHSMEKGPDHSIKMKSYETQDVKYQTHFQKLLNVTDLLMKCWEVYRDGLRRLSQRYYYAWVVTKAQQFLKILLNDDYLSTYKPTLILPPFTTGMLTKLEELAETSLARIQQLKKASKNGRRADAEDTDGNGNLNVNGNNYSAMAGTNSDMSTDDISINHKNSVGSTSSAEEYKPNEQIDSIWLQMMNMKNDDPTNKFYGNSNTGEMMNNPLTAQTPSFLAQGMDGSGVGFSPGIGLSQYSFGSQGVMNSGIAAGGNNGVSGFGGGGVSGGGNYNFSSIFDTNSVNMFENFPIDEFFKDLS